MMIKRLYNLSISIVFTLILCLSSYGHVSAQKNGLIDIKFKDAELVDVITILAEKGGYNIVAGHDVAGKVTFDLHSVTIQDALQVALKMNGYGTEKIGGILFVKPISQIEAKEAPSPPSPLTQLYLRSYKLNYIDASEIASVLKENISRYGKITVNKSNNIIVIEDIEEYLNRIDALIKRLDVVPKQVLIEAKILEIRLNKDTQLGVDWNQVFKSGKATFNLEAANFSPPPSAGTPGLFFSVFTPHFQMFLDTLQQKGDLKTLATPKLVALDNKEAQIIIGGRLGYQVTTTINQVTTTSVEFLDFGTMLKITPRIGDDGYIYLSIYPKISDGVITGGLPSETTTEVTTKVLVKDGESIFIGGLIRDRKEKTNTHIPILGSIPVLGRLFGRTTDSLLKAETVIVITPRIVDARSAEIFQKERERIESIEIDKFKKK